MPIFRSLLYASLTTLSAGLATPAPASQLAAPGPGSTVRSVLTTQQADAAGNVLTVRGNVAQMTPYSALPSQVWTVAATGGGYYRIQLFDAGNLYSLAATTVGGPLAIELSSHSLQQLWFLESVPGGGIVFRSAAHPFYAATGGTAGPASLLPLEWVPAQTWLQFPVDDPPPSAIVQVTSREYVAARPLPPVETRFRNNHDDPLTVLLANLRTRDVQRFEIPVRGEAVAVLERDAGGEIRETYEIVVDGQVVERETFVTPVPGRILYDVSVYEQFLQSIAIDRTGKSPSRIEDVNYQPRSIGIFPIPPGTAWRGGTIDVFARAVAERNPGAVRRFGGNRASRAGRPDPLERILEDQLRNQGRREAR